MKPFFAVVPLLIVLLLDTVAHAQNAPDDFDLAQWQRGGASLQSAPQNRERVTFDTGDWPSLRFVAPAPRDWTGQSLTLETFNPAAKALEFYVRVDDQMNSDGWNGARTAKMTALPGQTQRWVISLGVDPMSRGMRALPPLRPHDGATVVVADGAAPLNLQHIVAWQVFLSHPKEKSLLDVGALQLVPDLEGDLTGIVDGFGQYARADWPGKIHSVAELKGAQDAEERVLSARPALANRDNFGGEEGGPHFEATGFFRTQKEGGKWWLVTPDGHRFWSAGVDVVQSAQPTITAGREAMFASLPRDGEVLARFRGTENNVLMGPHKGTSAATFDFYSANLERKYGDDWKNRWTQTALQRLRSWGFNTVGNWSDDALRNAKWGAARVPYVATVYVWGEHARVPSGDDYWGQMHDPFDPKFAANVGARVAEASAQSLNDPYCLGYFVDNEMSWGNSDDANWRTRFGLAVGALGLNADSPAKAAFLADLKAKYPAIEGLNGAWNTAFKSWDELRAPLKIVEAPTEAQKGDFSAFLTHFADRYFQTVRDALRKADPNHLYLGCRFAWRTPEAVASAAKWCDVVSFNIYAKSLDANEWAFTGQLNKPILIGEFHMGALDRGMFHPGLVAAKDQSERAQLFSGYVESVARDPNFVGAHWFQYSDEALTGRPLDGENYNIGFVNATDTTYPELVGAARSANAQIYNWHAGK